MNFNSSEDSSSLLNLNNQFLTALKTVRIRFLGINSTIKTLRLTPFVRKHALSIQKFEILHRKIQNISFWVI